MSNRPLSPHLSIYKPQITSGTSITGRICGMYVYVFFIVIFWSIVFSIYKYTNATVPLYIIVMALKASTPLITSISYIILFATIFCLTFYTGTLVRHILWDHNIAIELKPASVFGYLIVALSVIIAILSIAFIAIK